ncbi:MAG: DUF4080 domain-containing protein [Bacillota bacterium]
MPENIKDVNIVLTTLNARYIHTALGLRYIYANLNELKSKTKILEFGINESIPEIAERILLLNPSFIGIGVYIWNALEVKNLISLIKKISPRSVIILGGPEVSHFPHRVDFSQADYIIRGEADTSFYQLISSLLCKENIPDEKVIRSLPADTSSICLPYEYYDEIDIKNRVLYVESSRGCPFTCEFCLSSIDKSVRYFSTDTILSEIEKLWIRGARKFKFVDRTFNLQLENTNRILDYFLMKKPPYLIHFEVIPDNLHESIKERLKLFPPASVQLEIGIQTLNDRTAENISRRMNFDKIKENLEFLEKYTNVHLHVDLITGLPGEPVESFADNLNTLTSLTNSEIQIGILKKLSGTSISRHDKTFGMIYSDTPPYEILQNDLIPFNLMQKMKRFARFWDLCYNSGNFNHTVRLLWKDSDVFKSFFLFSEWIYLQTESTWQISLLRLAELFFRYLTEVKLLNKTLTADTIASDILKINDRPLPGFLKEYASACPEIKKNDHTKINKRQLKHL